MKINVDGIIIETERERAKPDFDMIEARLMDLEYAVDELRKFIIIP